MRDLERAGLIESTPELRDLVAASPYAPEDIDRYFDLLVDAEGRTVGGTLDLDQLDGQHLGQLVLAGLIERGRDSWILTNKGGDVSRLLSEYAAGGRMWRRTGRQLVDG
jgi:hypothetical protein